MDLQGKIIAAMEPREGKNARGDWKVQEFLLETHDQYPRKMLFSVFGAERLARFNVQVGQEVTVSFDIDAHEYNGRWFNSIRAYDVRLIDPASVVNAEPYAPQPAAAPPAPDAPQPAPFSPTEEESVDDLPF